MDLRNVRVPVASLSVSGFQEPMKVEGGWFTWDLVVDGWKSMFRASAGAYALCGLEYGDFDEDGEIPPDACVSGTLAPGGTLSLRLDP